MFVLELQIGNCKYLIFFLQRFAWYSWNRVRSTLLSIRLDSCFGLVGPLQQPVIDSNVDQVETALIPSECTSSWNTRFESSNASWPPAAALSVELWSPLPPTWLRQRTMLDKTWCDLSTNCKRFAWYNWNRVRSSGPLSKPCWRQRASKLYA